jgi:hypothetical protein
MLGDRNYFSFCKSDVFITVSLLGNGLMLEAITMQ